MSKDNIPNWDIEIRAEVEFGLTIKAENFHEAFKKALEISQLCNEANVTLHAAELSKINKVQEAAECTNPTQDNVVEFQPSPQPHPNNDESY